MYSGTLSVCLSVKNECVTCEIIIISLLLHYEPCCTDCFYQLTRSSYIDKEENYGFGYPLLK